MAWSSTDFVYRFYFLTAFIPAAQEMILYNGGVSWNIRIEADGSLRVYDNGTPGVAQGVASAPLDPNVWYRIDIESSSSLLRVRVEGVEIINTNPGGQVLETPIFGKFNNLNSSSVEFYYDDVSGATTTGEYPLGPGRIIARQPGAGLGTPTYNAWTKSTGTDAGALWDNTPFTTGDFCSIATAATAQTSFVSPFSAGVDPIRSLDIINAAQVALVAKTSATSSGGTSMSIRRRVNAADTDSAVVLDTLTSFLTETTLWTTTLANLDAMQAGAITGTGTRTKTVYDVWVFIDYTPVHLPKPWVPSFGPILAQ